MRRMHRSNQKIQCVWHGCELTREDIREILEDFSHWAPPKLSRTSLTPSELARQAPHCLQCTSFEKIQGEEILQNAFLPYVDLRDAEIDGVDFSGATMNYADLRRASLQSVNLTKAKLDGADFRFADLLNAKCEGAFCNGTLFGGAELVCGDFRRSRLKGARFQRAELVQAKLQGADISRAKLQYANLNNANLQYAMAERAEFGWANLKGANLAGTNLKDANLFKVEYDPKNLKCRGVNAATCYGDPRFRRDLMDQDFLLQMQEGSKGNKRLYKLWKWSCNCGRNFWRWAVISFGLAVIFAIAYSVLEWLSPDSFKFPHNECHTALKLGSEGFRIHGDMKFDFFTMLYYSIVTFTTLGFGDVTPLSKLAAILVTLEVIVGYIMLGGLISIFANILARRS